MEKIPDLNKDVFKIMIRGGGCSHYVGMAVHVDERGPNGKPIKPGMMFACDIPAVFPVYLEVYTRIVS